MDHSTSELYDKFFAIAERGDEEAARKFLIENLDKFPLETQDKILTAFLEDALAKGEHADDAISEMQKKGIATVELLQKAKKELEKKLKLAEIKDSI